LQVKQGQVIVRAPHFVKDAFIRDFLNEKSVWLKGKIAAQQYAQINYFDFCHGSELFLFGEKVKVIVSYGKKNLVFSEISKHDNNQSYLNVIISERSRKKFSKSADLARQIKKQLESYFKGVAQDYIVARVAEFSERILLTPRQINIRQYRARWGSCNSRKEVSFNYLLAMAPPWVIDYVIVHELCHLKHLNHATSFWLLVAKHYPNYQEAKQWLSNHQSELVWQLPD